MKGGLTHLAHKAQHAMDLVTGAIGGVTAQGSTVLTPARTMQDNVGRLARSDSASGSIRMLLVRSKRINWDTCQIGIPGATAKDKENRRIPFNPKGRLAAILKRRTTLGPEAFAFGSASGEYQPRSSRAPSPRDAPRQEG